MKISQLNQGSRALMKKNESTFSSAKIKVPMAMDL